MTNETLRDKLIRLVTKLVNVDYEGGEKEGDDILREIETMVPAAQVVNLIYYGDDNDTAEMLADKMLAARPIILPDHSQS
ncbi:hypothetical protein D3C71_188140 [compost metagenome]